LTLLSSSVVSCRTKGSFSSPTPLKPTKGDYGHDGTNGPRDGKDIGVHLDKDVEL